MPRKTLRTTSPLSAIGLASAHYGIKAPCLDVDATSMRIQRRKWSSIAFLLAGHLLAGCATMMSERELGARLDLEGQAVASRQAMRKIFPVYAQTKVEEWILRSEAKSDPASSPLSVQLANGFRIGQRRRIDYVIGGPFPELSDQLVLNGLLLNEGRALPGLRVVLVSPAAPTPALRRAAHAKRVRLEHRVLD